MEVLLQFIEPYRVQVLTWWQSLGPAGPYYVWLGSGVLGLVLLACFSYFVMRFAFGHRKIRGVWFRPGELDDLLDRLTQLERDGVILDVQDVQLLDHYRPDRRDRLKGMGEREFVSW